MATIGGLSGRAGEGRWKGMTWLSTMAAIGFIRSSIFSRDWAWLALVAEARKRSTKLCRCLRCSSCFLMCFAWMACCSRRCVSKLS